MSRISPRFHYVALTALIALSIDLMSKSLANRTLSTQHITHFGPLRLRLVYNQGSTFHPHHSSLTYLIGTRLLVVAVLVAILFVLKSRVAAVGIGLLFAAGIGNFLGLALAPHRVTDFILLGTAFNKVWTGNLADFYAFFGIIIMSCSMMMRFIQVLRSLDGKQSSSAEQPLSAKQLT
jgi:lipoprotein signal peptidase